MFFKPLFWLAGVAPLWACGGGHKVPTLDEPYPSPEPAYLYAVSGYYPYVETVVGPTEPVLEGEEVEIHVSLRFPKGTPESLVIEPRLYWLVPPVTYFSPPAHDPSRGDAFLLDLAFIEGQSSWWNGARSQDMVSLERLSDEVAVLTLILPARDLEPWDQNFLTRTKVGFGVVLLLAAGSYEDAGLINWLVPSDHPSSLDYRDRVEWDKHAYADGKLKWFYYEYPVLPREDSGSGE